MIKILQCDNCKNYLGNNSCKAYKVIPDKLLNNEISHEYAYNGDNGIRYDAISGNSNNSSISETFIKRLNLCKNISEVSNVIKGVIKW